MIVKQQNNKIEVFNNLCSRGYQYAISKNIKSRILRTKVKSHVLATDKKVSEDMFFKIIRRMKKLDISNKKKGDIVLENILNTGINIIVEEVRGESE